MEQRYFEDLKVGDRFKSQTYKVSEEQIISFAREFDPQPFHLDRKVAEQSMLVLHRELLCHCGQGGRGHDQSASDLPHSRPMYLS